MYTIDHALNMIDVVCDQELILEWDFVCQPQHLPYVNRENTYSSG